jgi:hypothetical protein
MFQTAYAGGATDKSVHLRGFTASTGLPYTGGAFNTAGITAKYRRSGANAEATITLATQTANGAHSDGGFVHVSGGVYRLDLPDAAIASGSDYVDVWVYGITDVVFDTAHVDILGGDPRAAALDANVVQISGDSGAADNLEAYCDGTTPMPVNATQISGDATAADNCEAMFDGTGYAGGTIRLGVNAAQVGGQTASASGTVTFPGTIASTTNITAAAGCAVSSIGANVITATSIATDAITAAKIAADAIGASELATDAVNEIVTAMFARAFSAAYGSYTFDELVKLMSAALLGKASGLGTTTAVYRNLADNANVVVATVDADGNRTAVTRTP